MILTNSTVSVFCKTGILDDHAGRWYAIGSSLDYYIGGHRPKKEKLPRWGERRGRGELSNDDPQRSESSMAASIGAVELLRSFQRRSSSTGTRLRRSVPPCQPDVIVRFSTDGSLCIDDANPQFFVAAIPLSNCRKKHSAAGFVVFEFGAQFQPAVGTQLAGASSAASSASATAHHNA